MSDLETRQLRYFVAVAEELHFGRAAERLAMAQPPLSRAIRDLERQLGVDLFVRTTRQVALTPAGETLLIDARVALDAIAAAAQRARRAGRPEQSLRLTCKADFDGGLLAPILAAYDTTPVELLLTGPWDLVPALHDGRADVALLAMPFDDPALDSEALLIEPRMVALPAADPLAARTTLRLADLTGRRLPNGSGAETGNLAPPPPGSPAMRDLSQIFNLVETGSLLWFLPAWVARQFPRPHIAYRLVEDLPPATLAVAWPASSRSPQVAAFVRAAVGVARQAAPNEPRAMPVTT
ncbi:LysR family transcriptional regulator [Winogradskya consettensis]|uniref:LysR family transcriptional regulator n=1 Tax=Winogradskya consettensis TaxID=113560 RepID=A0A919SJZ3_9ACTN|nr:LysR family transcriptional regulator [Actinoplanes consettensis]GIM74160.1 LysR family transcriptional regulator [Actinoplanes consettensis]